MRNEPRVVCRWFTYFRVLLVRGFAVLPSLYGVIDALKSIARGDLPEANRTEASKTPCYVVARIGEVGESWAEKGKREEDGYPTAWTTPAIGGMSRRSCAKIEENFHRPKAMRFPP